MSRRTRPRLESLEGRSLLAAGALDTTFGGTGMVTTQVGYSQFGESSGAVVQPDDKVVVAGASRTSPSSALSLTLVRYNTDGTIDTSFGSSGIVKTTLPGSSSTLTPDGIALQPDGKIVVAATGYSQASKNASYTYSFVVARYNANGTLDTAFGSGGLAKVAAAAPTVPGYASGLALQPDGRIVVSATMGVAGGLDYGLLRLTTAGVLDPTFGSGGEVMTTLFGRNNDYADEMTIDGSGRILVAGRTQNASLTPGMGLVRYNPNGTLDTTFGSGGKVFDPAIAASSVTGLGIQSTGKIVVLGAANSQREFILERYNVDGSLDDGSASDSTPGDSFGVGGHYADARIAVNHGQYSYLYGNGNDLVIQPGTDEILAAGAGVAGSTTPSAFLVTQVEADGSGYDASFGVQGIGTAVFGASSNYSTPFSLALGPDGKLVVTGRYMPTTSTNLFATARFQGDALAAPASAPSPALATAGRSATTSVTASSLRLDPVLVPLVFDQPTLLDDLLVGKQRRSIW